MTIAIDPTARISSLADIEDGPHRIVIGANSVVDSFVKIESAGASGDLVIGAHVVINSGCVITAGNGMTIGSNTAIAANCVFSAIRPAYAEKDRLIRDQHFQPSRGGIIIEEDVWIGAGCIILEGAILRRGCVIAAASLVDNEVPAYSVQGGNPLRLLGWRK